MPTAIVYGEAATVAFQQADYGAALLNYLRGDMWLDAAYVAELVMSVEELRGFQQRLALDAAQALHVDKAGVEEVARRWRNHGQRVARIAARHFVVGQMVRQTIKPHVGQALAEELTPA